MRRLLDLVVKFIQGVMVALFTIGISVIMTLNLRSIYSYSIDKYNLTEIGQVSKKALMGDYNILLKYLQNPFIEKLEFNNFTMSSNGEFHFYEVKEIFLKVYIIVILILISFIVIYIIKKLNNKKFNLFKLLNYGANALTAIIMLLLVSAFTNFSKAFIVFHKIFFNNDYWIFDPRTDPIIDVLPEEVFKLYAIIVIAIVILAIIIYKSIYLKMKSKF